MLMLYAGIYEVRFYTLENGIKRYLKAPGEGGNQQKSGEGYACSKWKHFERMLTGVQR